MSPPITTTCGLSRLIGDGEQTRRGAVRSRGAWRLASASPASASAVRSRMWSTARARLGAAGPPGPSRRRSSRGSRSSPQRQGTTGRGVDLGVPDVAGAAEVAADHPALGEDAEAEAGRGLDHDQVVVRRGVAEPLRQGEHVGVVADMERSRSVRRPRSRARRSTPSQPAITGESRLTPRTGSIVPGRLMPMPRTGAVGSHERRAGGARRPASRRRARRRPRARPRRSPSSSPARSKTASWERDRPIAAASTTPASTLNTRLPGGATAGGGQLLAQQEQPGVGQGGDAGRPRRCGTGRSGGAGRSACSPCRTARARSRSPAVSFMPAILGIHLDLVSQEVPEVLLAKDADRAYRRRVTLPTTELATELPACDFMVFGGTGDLALRKLLPALYQREREHQLPPTTRIIGASRSDLRRRRLPSAGGGGAGPYVAPADLDPSRVDRLLDRVHHLTLDAADPEGWHLLHGLLKERERGQVRVFYLAVAPALFGPICDTPRRDRCRRRDRPGW